MFAAMPRTTSTDLSNMLQLIREKFTGGLAIAMLALIGVPFLFFGINYDFIGTGFAAKVNGVEIGVNRFEQTYREQLQENPQLAELPDEYRMQIRQGALNSLISSQLIELHLADAGYRISDEQVAGLLHTVQEFQVDGVFDKDTYYSLLEQNGLEPILFEESQRRRMRQRQLQRGVQATAVVTPAEYRRYLNLVAEQRLVSLAVFDVEGIADDFEIGADQITAFYDDNPTLFQLPESADIEYIEVRRDAIVATIDVSEEDLQEHYEDSRNRYLQDEQRQARHILILHDDDEDAAEATANDVLARVQAGESFAALASEFSQDTSTAAQGGDLGVRTKSQLPGELGGTIFSMEEGSIVGPIKSDSGFHIVRLDSVLVRGPLPLDQVRGELLSELRDRESDNAFRALERQVSDALFDAEDMQAISAIVGIDVNSASGYMRSGGEPFGSNQAAIDAVFDASVLVDGDISDVIEIDANTSAVFKVTKHNPAARQALDDVSDEIVAEIRSQEAEKIVVAKAEQLMQALAAGDDFGAAAEAGGATVENPRLISRQDQDLDPAVLFQIFAANKPTTQSAVTDQVANIGGGYTVFSLDAVLPGRPESIPVAERDAGKLQLAQRSGGSDYQAFVQALYDNADIIINEDALAGQDLLQ